MTSSKHTKGEMAYRFKDRKMPRITYDKSDVVNLGWRGWQDSVAVYLDGEPIGKLVGTGSNKSQLEYHYVGDHPISKHTPKLMVWVGITKARISLESCLDRYFKNIKPPQDIDVIIG